jgi:integrase
MYTGARIEELAMLKKSDLDFVEQLIHIRGTKTDAAKRVVPMHPTLVPLLSALKPDAKEEYVISALTVDSRGERGKAMGKRFGRLKTAMGYTGRDRCFHSIGRPWRPCLNRLKCLRGSPPIFSAMKNRQ